jgi:hypothetical protein
MKMNGITAYGQDKHLTLNSLMLRHKYIQNNERKITSIEDIYIFCIYFSDACVNYLIRFRL